MAPTQQESRNENASSPLLDLLDNDLLQAVLLRTSASDHLSLRLTSHRIRNILDSELFFRERCDSDFSEVSAVLLTPWEQYSAMYMSEATITDARFINEYNDLGFVGRTDNGQVRISARIMVDGKEAGNAHVTLLPRNNLNMNFHELSRRMMNSHTKAGVALANLCDTFFDSRACPLVSSVRDALGDDTGKKEVLLLSLFLLSKEYRTTTTVGAKALRSMLMDTAIAGRWSVAFYVPEDDNCTLYTEDDLHRATTVLNLQYRAVGLGNEYYCPSYDEILEEREWEERCHELSKVSMRQFFRAGFLQVKETAPKSNCYHVFAVPSFLQTKKHISHNEALSVDIAELPRRDHRINARRLYFAMKWFCSRRQEICMVFESFQRTGWNHPETYALKLQLEDRSKEVQRKLARRDRLLRQLILQQQEGSRLNAEMNRNFILIESELADPSTREKALVRIQNLNSIMGWQCNNVAEMRAIYEEGNIYEKSTLFLAQEATTLFEETRDDMLRLHEEARLLQTLYRQLHQSKSAKLEQDLRELDARVRKEVSKFVGESGHDVVASSESIHWCALHLIPSFVELLMEFVPDDMKAQAINKFDRSGLTPLMVAASAYRDKSSQFDTCQRIVNLGADKNIVAESGLSALGEYRKGRRRATSLEMSTSEIDPGMEAFLMPSRGPTAADDAILIGVFGNEDDNADDA